MGTEHYPPAFEVSSFYCPYCDVKAMQHWGTTKYFNDKTKDWDVSFFLKVCICDHCGEITYWLNGKMIHPLATNAPMPHPDIPESIISDYNEARDIVNRSPRGAAALLRLCIQKLMKELGESGNDINKDIGSLVSKGLPVEVQQALDIVRVIGNESVHPGELDLRDDQETALQLFELINFIIEERISRKKRINVLFQKLPEGKRQGIETRDKTS